MRITEANLRKLVRASLLSEASLATASDIARFKPQLEEWIIVLVDEMAETFPRMKEITEKQRKSLIRSLLHTTSIELVSLTSGMSMETRKELSRREKQKSHEKWDMERKRRGSGVEYWGDFRGSWSK